MDSIGSSNIALPDLIIIGIAGALHYYLTTLPPNSLICRVLAVLCSIIVVAIMGIIPLANNLTSSGVYELSFVGVGLAIGLWNWNDARIKSRRDSMTPPEFSK